MGHDVSRIFGDLDFSRRHLIVAVSGGSDSLALLLLLKDHLDRHAPAAQLLAVTVDHGLREEAAREAEAVADFCRARVIAHRTVVWRGDKPKTGTIAAAREARYDLLAQAAAEFGADCILTGHTMDDQAETVAMRARRGAGTGLSGMAGATLFDGRVWIVRPLLGMRRQALRSYLSRQGLGWIDDPTNLNPAYERVRMRAQLAASDGVEALARQAAEAGVARRQMAAKAAGLLDRFASRPAPGLFRLDAAILADVDDAAIHAMRVLLAVVGGTPHLPELARTQALLGTVARTPARVALSRAIIDRRKQDVWLLREARGLPEALPATRTAVWDGRWRVFPAAATELQVVPLGRERAAELAPDFDAAPQSLVRAALCGEPAVLGGSGLLCPAWLAEPGCHDLALMPVAAPFARFLPDFDLDLAHAVARLLQTRPPPSPPWKDHIDAEA